MVNSMNANDYDAVVREYLPRIRAVISKILRTSRYYGESHLDDVCQETCLYLVKVTLPAFDPDKGALGPFVLRQAHHVTINYLKAHCRSKHHAEISTTDASADDGVSPFVVLASGTDERKAQELRLTLRACIARLAADDARFVLAYLEMGSIYQAGEVVGDTRVQATRRKMRVWAALKEMML